MGDKSKSRSAGTRRVKSGTYRNLNKKIITKQELQELLKTEDKPLFKSGSKGGIINDTLPLREKSYIVEKTIVPQPVWVLQQNTIVKTQEGDLEYKKGMLLTVDAKGRLYAFEHEWAENNGDIDRTPPSIKIPDGLSSYDDLKRELEKQDFKMDNESFFTKDSKPVLGYKIDTPFSVETDWGKQEGAAGSWLIEDANPETGKVDRWIVEGETFDKTYNIRDDAQRDVPEIGYGFASSTPNKEKSERPKKTQAAGGGKNPPEDNSGIITFEAPDNRKDTPDIGDYAPSRINSGERSLRERDNLLGGIRKSQENFLGILQRLNRGDNKNLSEKEKKTITNSLIDLGKLFDDLLDNPNDPMIPFSASFLEKQENTLKNLLNTVENLDVNTSRQINNTLEKTEKIKEAFSNNKVDEDNEI